VLSTMGTRCRSVLVTPGMPLSISSFSMTTASPGMSHARTAESPCECTTAPAPRRRTIVRKMSLHSEGRSVSSEGRSTTLPVSTSIRKRSWGRTRSLWTPVGASHRCDASSIAQMPPPVPETQPLS
jgi:hypothetical protein